MTKSEMRAAIVSLLSERGPMMSTEMASAIGVPVAPLTRQLSYSERLGLIVLLGSCRREYTLQCGRVLNRAVNVWGLPGQSPPDGLSPMRSTDPSWNLPKAVLESRKGDGDLPPGGQYVMLRQVASDCGRDYAWVLMALQSLRIAALRLGRGKLAVTQREAARIRRASRKAWGDPTMVPGDPTPEEIEQRKAEVLARSSKQPVGYPYRPVETVVIRGV